MTSPTSVSPAPGFEHPHSCTVCYKRKVKCDRKHPCSNCLKHQTECEFRDPLPRQRKRKHPEREDGDGTADAMIMSRLRSCEDTLRKIGIDPMRVEDGDLSLGSKRSADSRPGQDRIRVGPGRLISKEGRSIYIDKLVYPDGVG